jgi:hypothetical protein
MLARLGGVQQLARFLGTHLPGRLLTCRWHGCRGTRLRTGLLSRWRRTGGGALPWRLGRLCLRGLRRRLFLRSALALPLRGGLPLTLAVVLGLALPLRRAVVSTAVPARAAGTGTAASTAAAASTTAATTAGPGKNHSAWRAF